jgi:AmmeMemoRadiSam system protein A
MLSPQDRKTLLALARGAIEAALTGRPKPQPDVENKALRAPCGCFVTLRNHGELRGCIGTFSARAPLCQTVRQMAAAALRDPRFLGRPVTAAELPRIDIEISVLTPLERIRDPMKEIELGRHGICIDGPYGSGCFLPQVATETGWSLEEFLSHCAAGKAGLPPDAWKWPDVTVSRFEAEVFGEEEGESAI